MQSMFDPTTNLPSRSQRNKEWDELIILFDSFCIEIQIVYYLPVRSFISSKKYPFFSLFYCLPAGPPGGRLQRAFTMQVELIIIFGIQAIEAVILFDYKSN